MLLLAGLSLWGTPAGAAGEHWLRISSDHFIVITDGNEKAGHEVAVRFEQMRAIFGQLLMRSKVRMAEPLEIIALAGDQEYAPLAPRIDGQPAVGPGLWLAGDDRIFVVLNLAEPASWEGIAHQFAHYLLNYNYPPTPAWFDEGFAEYFASLHLRSKYAEVGGDPELTPAGADPAGNQAHAQDLKSFAEILRNPVWLAWPDLLATRNRTTRGAEGAQHRLFYAQSWILVHYLLNKDKMSDLGKYFGLVEIQKVPTEEAIRQGFGVSVAELDHEVKDYFRGLAPKLGASGGGQPADAAKPVYQLPLPFEDLGTSSKPVPVAEAQALVDEMQLRLSPRRQSAFADLEKLIADPKTETVVAHRALAWAYIEKGETDDAFKELNQAVHINDRDPWTRFGLALASYHSGQQGARVQGLANMMESLHVVIDEYPDFAEAYNMLGWARLAGGGPNAAVDSMKMAVELSPRSEPYQLRLAQAYLEAKKFSQATPILDRLKLSQSPEVAETASKALTDLPFLEKYGVPPEPAAVPKSSAGTANTGPADEEDDQTASNRKPAEAEPAIDKRAVKFLKATLVSVDCSKPPAAMLSVAQGNRLLKLRTPDYKSLPVIGAQDFSCAWKGIRVNINYRPSGLTGGDLVSIEIPEAGRQ